MENPIAIEPKNNQVQDGDELEEQKVLETNPHLSRKETRQIVTPYAFFVADDLLGTPLARPFRRAFALLVDMILVAMLTQVSSLVLAAVAAGTFFKAGNRLKTKKRFNGVRIFLRFLVALLLFVVAMGIVDSINDNSSESKDTYTADPSEVEIAVKGAEILGITTKYLIETAALKNQINQNECEPAYQCVQTLGIQLFNDVSKLGINQNGMDEVFEGYIGAVSDVLNEQEIQNITEYFKEKSSTLDRKLPKNEPHPKAEVSTPEDNSEFNKDDQYIDDIVDKGVQSSDGIINWVESVVEDLGLGFGWAAFYFSIFTAWLKGQTPGKKLMGIKVIKLDNNPLNLWESFGRYGGYGAGFATGLLGFLQVYWDPNRQAIQDKISETLVIDIRRPKVPFNLGKAD